MTVAHKPAHCPACGLALHGVPALGVRLLEQLAAEPMTAGNLAKSVRRRRAVVDRELDRLEAEGLVERLPERGRGRGWRGMVWRPLESMPGRTTDAAWTGAHERSEYLAAAAAAELRAALRAARASLALAEQLTRRSSP